MSNILENSRRYTPENSRRNSTPGKNTGQPGPDGRSGFDCSATRIELTRYTTLHCPRRNARTYALDDAAPLSRHGGFL